MLSEMKKEDLFCEYYARWIMVYKKGAIRKVTMDKYLMTQKWLEKLIPELKICDMNRIAYQQLLNDYAEDHERQTTMDFSNTVCRAFHSMEWFSTKFGWTFMPVIMKETL